MFVPEIDIKVKLLRKIGKIIRMKHDTLRFALKMVFQLIKTLSDRAKVLTLGDFRITKQYQKSWNSLNLAGNSKFLGGGKNHDLFR